MTEPFNITILTHFSSYSTYSIICNNYCKSNNSISFYSDEITHSNDKLIITLTDSSTVVQTEPDEIQVLFQNFRFIFKSDIINDIKAVIPVYKRACFESFHDYLSRVTSQHIYYIENENEINLCYCSTCDATYKKLTIKTNNIKFIYLNSTIYHLSVTSDNNVHMFHQPNDSFIKYLYQTFNKRIKLLGFDKKDYIREFESLDFLSNNLPDDIMLSIRQYF